MENEMLQRITRVEEKVNNMNEKLDRAINANEIAVKALASADSAHKRLDKIDKIIFWVGTTIIGLVLVAVVGLTLKG
ncbi:hemolysin XhlA family protein [Escherichia coli]|uniref:hemolysin XhlA family protein n=1 Tax=Escherichia coli TaxID=562 RepID=UPI001AECEFE4|nr:hemolysin XhlA family protein [Escherichia coli]MBP2898918.1 hemolysin XhlA family protein [Escherichia coli]